MIKINLGFGFPNLDYLRSSFIKHNLSSISLISLTPGFNRVPRKAVKHIIWANQMFLASGSRPINFFSARGFADRIFFVIGLSSNQVPVYAVVARHMLSGLAYGPIQFFTARNRANQGFSLSDCRPLKFLVLGGQSISFHSLVLDQCGAFMLVAELIKYFMI